MNMKEILHFAKQLDEIEALTGPHWQRVAEFMAGYMEDMNKVAPRATPLTPTPPATVKLAAMVPTKDDLRRETALKEWCESLSVSTSTLGTYKSQFRHMWGCAGVRVCGGKSMHKNRNIINAVAIIKRNLNIE